MASRYITDEQGNRQELADIAAYDEAKAREKRGEAEYVSWEKVRGKIGSEYED